MQRNSLECICPECGQTYYGYPAISRQDMTTRICPDCGLKEALKDSDLDSSEQQQILKTIQQFQNGCA